MENKRRKHFPDNNWFRQDASRNEELMEWNGMEFHIAQEIELDGWAWPD